MNHWIPSIKYCIITFLLLFELLHYKSALVITNRMRYSQTKGYGDLQGQTSYLSYTSYPVKSELNKYNSLNEEDKNLLDKFYHQTQNNQTSKDKTVGIENIWRSKLLDISSDKLNPESEDLKNKNNSSINNIVPGWQVDMKLLKQAYESRLDNEKEARYSPLLRILTSYDPLDKSPEALAVTPTINRIVGMTIGANSLDVGSNINSSLAINAIKLHDDMLEPAPRDGKMRIRMYYHQAIHDDVKLYGTGPWKYWGHGWGMELGYNPKNRTKDFFQRGYSIERAYGRDFCRDQTKCRKSDPTFFDNMLDAGKYTKTAINR